MVYLVIFLLIHCIRHVKMQLNDVIKSIGWYQAFVSLPTQINIPKYSINTDTGIYWYQCITIKTLFWSLVIFIKNFDPINIRRP